MPQDALGNDVTTTDPATLAGIDDFVTGFLGYETKATNVLAAADADPDSVLANIYAGFTWMFLEAAGAEERAQFYLDRARVCGDRSQRTRAAPPRPARTLDRRRHRNRPAHRRRDRRAASDRPRVGEAPSVLQLQPRRRRIDAPHRRSRASGQHRQRPHPRHARLRPRADASHPRGRTSPPAAPSSSRRRSRGRSMRWLT